MALRCVLPFVKTIPFDEDDDFKTDLYGHHCALFSIMCEAASDVLKNAPYFGHWMGIKFRILCVMPPIIILKSAWDVARQTMPTPRSWGRVKDLWPFNIGMMHGASALSARSKMPSRILNITIQLISAPISTLITAAMWRRLVTKKNLTHTWWYVAILKYGSGPNRGATTNFHSGTQETQTLMRAILS